MANNNGTIPTLDVPSKRPIITLTAARTLSEDQSGAVVVLNAAAGFTVTLPAACANGTFFDFVVGVTVTSVGAKVITGAATELMVGNIISTDTDSADAIASWKSHVGASNISFTLNGTTRGGLIGDRIIVTKITSTTWQVTGTTLATGVVATPFATS
jgi:hypothetical protein